MHFDAQDVQNYIKSVVSTHEGKQLSKKPREAVSSAVSDLVPRSRFGGSRAKTGGGGRGGGRERRKRDLAKYDCVGQNLAHASTAHAPSLVYSTVIELTTRCVLLLKTRFTKFKALKTQTVRDCKGCIAAGQHVLAVLPTEYGKTLTGLPIQVPVAAKHFGIFVP